MLAPVARLQLREEVVVAGGRWLEDQAVEAAPAHRHHDLLLESLVILGRGREHHQIVAPRRPLDRTEDRVDAGDSADSGPEGAADAPSKLTRAFVGLIRHGGNRRIDPLDELRPHVRLLIDDTRHGSETHTCLACHVDHRRTPTGEAPISVLIAGSHSWKRYTDSVVRHSAERRRRTQCVSVTFPPCVRAGPEAGMILSASAVDPASARCLRQLSKSSMWSGSLAAAR